MVNLPAFVFLFIGRNFFTQKLKCSDCVIFYKKIGFLFFADIVAGVGLEMDFHYRKHKNIKKFLKRASEGGIIFKTSLPHGRRLFAGSQIYPAG